MVLPLFRKDIIMWGEKLEKHPRFLGSFNACYRCAYAIRYPPSTAATILVNSTRQKLLFQLIKCSVRLLLFAFFKIADCRSAAAAAVVVARL